MGEHRVWGCECKTKLLSGKIVTELLCVGQPRHVIENNMKAWNNLEGARRFKLVRITKNWED